MDQVRESNSALERGQFFCYLLGWWICHCGTVWENQSWNSAVAAIYFFNNFCGAWYLFDIDLFEGNAEICKLRFQALAIAAPRSWIHDKGHGLILSLYLAVVGDLPALHFSEQYFTFSQSRAHFLRHSKGRSHRWHILGSKPFFVLAFIAVKVTGVDAKLPSVTWTNFK